jgi:pimeloyl-ACP methyl ester carboxylesterase
MLAADTLAVMDKLELSKVHVSGISMGGAIAQQLAIMAPERVKTLTLTSTWDKSDLFTVRMFQTLKSVYETVDPHTFNRLLQMLIYVSEYINDHGNELESKETENGIDNNRMSVEAFHAQCDACILHDTSDLLQQINMPVLITAGENDVMIPLHFPNKLASEISNSRLEIFKRGGHAFHWEQLEKFNRVTLEFLLENRFSQ